jgi:hypothetical protein
LKDAEEMKVLLKEAQNRQAPIIMGQQLQTQIPSQLVAAQQTTTQSGGDGSKLDEMRQSINELNNVVKLITRKTQNPDDSGTKVDATERLQIKETIKVIRDLISDKGLNSCSSLESTSNVFFEQIEKSISEAKVVINKASLQDFLEDIDELSAYVETCQSKISKYYDNKYTLMDMIMNKQFLFLYIVKGIRLGFITLALFLSARIFEEMYVKAVFTQNKDPPSLFIFLGIFLAFDMAFFLFTFITLALIRYIFADPKGAFVIDSQFLTRMVMDYAITTIFIGVIGLIVCDIIRKKKYFRYKLEGPRAIRAAQEVMFGISGVFLIIPTFLLL